MSPKPAVFVTRRLPDAVTERLSRTYQARLNPGDHPYTADEIVKGAAGADALIVTPSDKMKADVLALKDMNHVRQNFCSIILGSAWPS